MLKTVPILLSVFMLLIVALACVTPGLTTPDPNFIDTAIAQTYAAAATQTAEFLIPDTGQSPTPTRPASATPFPTYTLVVLATPEIRVSVNTNCRAGPGNLYRVVGVLEADEVGQLVGRSAAGNFWAIRNPDRPGEVCWISDQDATITGFTNLLPVFTPPPTPTPTPTQTPVPPTSAPTRTRTPVPTSPPASTPPLTPAISPTFTFTPTGLASPSPTASSTATFTPSVTPTELSTLSPTPTQTSTPSPTASSTATSTPSATSTDLASPSPTPTDTFTPSPTSTASSTSTPTPSATPTPTSTSTPSPTGTLTLSPTSTASSTPTSTSTPSPTSTASSTATSTPSPTPTGTLTLSPTSTASSTATSTLSPTPTPTGTLTPSFTAFYSGMESCPSLGWWMEFQLTNTGPASFDFMALIVTDTVTGTIRSLYSPDFTNRNGCATAITLDSFPPGATHIVSSAAFTYNPTGHRLNARIILCANPGPNGICTTQTIDFTP